jgi:hypothetical protein
LAEQNYIKDTCRFSMSWLYMCKLVMFLTWNRFIRDLCLTVLIKIVWTSFETVSCKWIND